MQTTGLITSLVGESNTVAAPFFVATAARRRCVQVAARLRRR